MPRVSPFASRLAATPDLQVLDARAFTAICLSSCRRLPAMRRTAAARHLDELVAAQAWIDAVLALIAIELPGWQLRRLAFDEGEWHCALSTERNMPDWLDDAVEAHHPDMAAAMANAFVNAVNREDNSHLVLISARPAAVTDAVPMCCENYA